jgi:hypothetical protein
MIGIILSIMVPSAFLVKTTSLCFGLADNVLECFQKLKLYVFIFLRKYVAEA